MFKKFISFLTVTIALFLVVGFMYLKYIKPDDYPVFIESFNHGVMTVDSADTVGSDSKYMIFCKSGETLTVNINPERNDKNSYDLEKLIVNGENVTKDVKMLQYKTKVNEKLTILAFFKKGKAVETSVDLKVPEYKNKPEILVPASNSYFGSENAYGFEDPSIIFDEKSGYYYCFGSGNVVTRSKDLLNWESKNNYFPVPQGSDNEEIMDFSEFVSVSKWAKTHGYDKDLTLSTPNNNRKPIGPEIIKIGSYYYLYFSLSKSANANESAIFCVRTTDLEYSVENQDWQDVGLVISSCGKNSGTDKKDSKFHYDESNAVHPSVFKDKDGGLFMAYGAYFGREMIHGGIYLVELNSKTGLLSKNDIINSKGKEISTLHGNKRFNTGVLIAKPGRVPALNKKEGSLVSACDLFYNSKNDYYYLFVTYGESQSNYNIRVARSKNVMGPFEDFSGNSMSKFSTLKSKNQYTKGLKLIGGYNFQMSSAAGVSYNDVGKASIGSPSIIKTSDGKFIMASQSRAYYKVEDEILTGEREFDKDQNVKAEMKASLEIRQIFFEENDWPVAVAEPFTGETAKTNIKQSQMNGRWDVVVLDRAGSTTDFKAVERSVSTPVTIIDSIALSEIDISKKTKLSKLHFEKKTKTSYEILLNGEMFTVYPTVAWDWELNEPTLVFSGIGEKGNTIFGKKNYSAFTGINTDALEYLLSYADDTTQNEYREKLNKMSGNPSQAKIDSMTIKIAKAVLNG